MQAAHLRQQRIERWTALGFTTPALVLFLLTGLLPLVVLFWLSFTDYELGAIEVRRLGFANFTRAFLDPAFHRAFVNTLVYVAIVLPGAVGLGLLVAILVHGRRRTRGFYEVAYFLPVTSTLIAMATVWQFLLHPRLGPVNALLRFLGIGEIAFLSEPQFALPTLAVVGIWQLLGFNMVLFLAGLSAIPKDLYEAAEVDGATRWQKLTRITLPLLRPVILVAIALRTIGAFKVFDIIYVLTGNGGPADSTKVISFYAYDQAFRYLYFGYGSAVAWLITAFILILIAIYMRLLRSEVEL